MTKRNTLTGLQTVDLGILIREHCRLVPDGCAYEDGWSDQRVADEFGCALSNVKGLRMQLRGKLVTPPPAPVADPRVDLLVERFNALVRMVGHPDLIHDYASLEIKP